MKLVTYLKETRSELKNVSWPKWSVAFTHTFAVIVIAGVVGYLSGLLDSAFKLGLTRILGI